MVSADDAAHSYGESLLRAVEHPRDADRAVNPGLIAIAQRAGTVLEVEPDLDEVRPKPLDSVVWVTDRDGDRPVHSVGVRLPSDRVEHRAQFFFKLGPDSSATVHRYRATWTSGWVLTERGFAESGDPSHPLTQLGADGLTDGDRALLRQLDAAMDGLLTAGLRRAGEDAVLAWLHDDEEA